MVHGPLLGARQALQHAKPWQRIAILVVAIGGGIALVVVGDPKGVILLAFGLLFTMASFPRFRLPWRPHDEEDAPTS